MPTVVFAPDSFKGTLDAASAARALADGWLSARPEDAVVLRPMADGGEGTLAAFATVPGAIRMPVTVRGPDDRDVDAAWLLLPPTPAFPRGTGVVELASTSGIELLDELRPDAAHTIGFGQAIAAALDHGVSRLVLGIGSSASTDAGLGMLTALGARARDAAGAPLGGGLRDLAALAALDLTALRPLPPTLVVTDVTNPLLGPRGAAHVFGPQKGLDAAGIARADTALHGYVARFPDADPAAPGAGAAGGVGFTLHALGARLGSGAAEVAELVGLDAALAGADAVVTGEGAYDRQSADGKVPAFVAAAASARRVPVLLAAGRIAPDAELGAFAGAVSLVELAGSADAATADPARWLHAAGAHLAAHPDVAGIR